MKKKLVKRTETVEAGAFWTRGEWLETVIKLSKTAINDDTNSENGMIYQVDNLVKEFKQWRKNETKGKKA